MTSKERARLRGLANGIETVLQIGKDGIGENLIRQADITLEARELIKGRVLDGCMDYTSRTAAEALAQATGSEVIQVIGSKFVLYRKKKAVETDAKPRKTQVVKRRGSVGKAERRDERRKPSSRPGERRLSNRLGEFKPSERFGQRDERRKASSRPGRRKPGSFGKRDEERKPSQSNRDEQRASRFGERKPSEHFGKRDEARKPSERFGARKPFSRSGERKPLSRPGERKAVKFGAAQRPGQARDIVRGGRNKRK